MEKYKGLNLEFISRKQGTFIKLQKQGFKPRIYKWDKNMLDAIVMFYYDTIKNERHGKLQSYNRAIMGSKIRLDPILLKQTEKYLKKISKHKKFEENIKQGKSKNIINDIYTSNENKVKDCLKTLFKPMVLDYELLNILILEENMQRIKTRFAHSVFFYTNNSDQIGESITGGNKTLREVIKEIQDIVPKGTQIGSSGDPTIKQLGKQGYSYKPNLRFGTVDKINIEIRFRKG